MALLTRFDPPAFFTDFDHIPGQREAWHEFMSRVFDAAIAVERKVLEPAETVQFFNPAKQDHGAAVDLAITWNAFPKELLRQYGRPRALVEADRDRLVLTEYCEWHVERDPQTNAIVRVTFTSEPPEYWEAMYGGQVTYEHFGTKKFTFPGSPDTVLRRYRELVSPHVEPHDLVANGAYDKLNKWNSTHGIMHLTAPPNTLAAEVQLGADATVTYRNARGDVLVEPEALICCAGYGGPDRNSDPTIGATVNALARLGAMITLANPVGLYMDHIDLSGWSAPKGVDVEECVRIVRGDVSRRMIERLVVEVPRASGYTVSDLSIGEVPIAFGGHIAECITVKLIGSAAALGTVRNGPIACGNRCCVDPAYFVALGDPVPNGEAAPPGTVVAFGLEGGAPAAHAQLAHAAAPRRGHRLASREHIA